MSRARDLGSAFSSSSNTASDTEVATAVSTHATAANGHVGRGSTANRPASPTIGDTYFDTTLGVLISYTSAGWVKVSQDPAPQIASISPTTAATTGTTITITGSNFKSALSVQFIGTNSTAYNSPVATFVGATTATATTPALPTAYEPYDVKVINADNQFAILENCLDSGGTPTWNTASGTITTINEQSSLSTSVSATDPDGTSIVYSSSNLPAWITLNSSTGALTGTAPDIASNTTYSFDITASDGVNTSSRSFNVVSNYVLPLQINYLVVAGGGGGGSGLGSSYYASSGGGAGGLRSTVTATGGGGTLESILPLTAGVTYTVTVGSGGTYSNKGENSSISGSGITTITSIGGGAGSPPSGGDYAPSATSPMNGGSGGGGGDPVGTGQTSAGTGTPNQGYAGANTPGGRGFSGGGGGAGATGNLSNGGNGIQSSITGTLVYYAGGGGGVYGEGNTAGTGGLGGGANGSNYGTGSNASGNTGGGGGGAGYPGSGVSQRGSSGGSGIVVISSNRIAVSTSGSPTYTTSGSNYIYQFTGTGSITF